MHNLEKNANEEHLPPLLFWRQLGHFILRENKRSKLWLAFGQTEQIDVYLLNSRLKGKHLPK